MQCIAVLVQVSRKKSISGRCAWSWTREGSDSSVRSQSKFAFKEWRIPGQKIDLIVEQVILVEAKVMPRIRPIHRAQVISYLKTLDLRVGLLINFNVPVLKDGFKRVVR